MELHVALIALGALLLAGLVADEFGRRTRLPRVTLLILFGFVASESALGLISDDFQDWYEFLVAIALTMVAFLLGGGSRPVHCAIMAKRSSQYPWQSLSRRC